MIDAFAGLFSGSGMNTLLRTSGAILTTLLVIPAIMKLFVVTIDEGSAAIRTRNGKPIIRRGSRSGDARGEVVVLRPGTHGAIPIFYWYRLIDVRARSNDLPVRHLTGAERHQHLVHASFDWRPLTTGHDLRVFELDVVNVTERAGNIVGAALRDIVHRLEGPVLPPNAELSPIVVAACADGVRSSCGIELVAVTVTGDALTDGYLLSEALAAASARADSPGAAAATIVASRLSAVG
ncbi:hypothetical protein [Microbacterium sp. CFBP9034]|uniref:hypothetical protein n=1 Tax=Microbacterium sp. CFBP9034 TaxID=3096540 RepID=UPI002A6A9953|nr:hypothetical protein [Microbacterium sp. CFBP9034]MDY0909731.1 hypothetical protein [Microbacterium sp. CFBP9034]